MAMGSTQVRHISPMKRILCLLTTLGIFTLWGSYVRGLTPISSARRLSSARQYHRVVPVPLSMCLWGSSLSRRLTKGKRFLQQCAKRTENDFIVSSYNTAAERSGQKERLVIALPLTQRFEYGKGHILQGRLHYSDKMSVGSSLLDQITDESLEPPWIVQLTPVVRGEAHNTVRVTTVDHRGDTHSGTQTHRHTDGSSGVPVPRRVFGSIADFRAPSGYVFIPHWMFAAMGVRPGCVVECVLVPSLPQGQSITIQPHTDVMQRMPHLKGVLEKELRHYSTLTSHTTVWLSLGAANGTGTNTVGLNVMKLKPSPEWYVSRGLHPLPHNSTVEAVCIQDSDVITDILPPINNTKLTPTKYSQQQTI